MNKPAALFDPALFSQKAAIRKAIQQPLAGKAHDVSSQIHFGEWRRITDTPFWEDHICAVAGAYAALIPDDQLGIAAAFLHDSVENAEKLIDRIGSASIAAQKAGKTAQAFLKESVPPIFVEFFKHFVKSERAKRGRSNGIDFSDPTHLVRAISVYTRSRSATTNMRLKKEFRLFVVNKIFTDFGADADQVVYILTRHKPDAFLHIHTISAEGTLRKLSEDYKAFKKKVPDHPEASAAEFLSPPLRRDNDLRKLWKKISHNKAISPAAFLANLEDEQTRSVYSRYLGDIRARTLLRHHSVLGDHPIIDRISLKKLLSAKNIGEVLEHNDASKNGLKVSAGDKIYATGYADNRNILLRHLLLTAVTIKCLDIVHNICTMTYDTDKNREHALKVISRTGYLLPFLARAIDQEKEVLAFDMAKKTALTQKERIKAFGVRARRLEIAEELICIANEALLCSQKKLFQATAKSITLPKAYTSQQARRAVFQKRRYRKLVNAIKRSPGTSLGKYAIG
jgi:hypothetical protein